MPWRDQRRNATAAAQPILRFIIPLAAQLLFYKTWITLKLGGQLEALNFDIDTFICKASTVDFSSSQFLVLYLQVFVAAFQKYQCQY